MFLFSKKTKYYNIIVITKDKRNIKLSLVKGKPIKEAFEQYNTHIMDTNEHILKVYKLDLYQNKIKYDIDSPLMNDIILYSY